MVRAMERKVRSRARQLYESRGQAEGQELQDWFQAETEVLGNTAHASLYRRIKSSSANSSTSQEGAEVVTEQEPACHASA